MASRLNPYLNFDGNAAQATEFYHRRLPSADCRISGRAWPEAITELLDPARLGRAVRW
ncbi:MAG: hypothetical protein IPM00_07130 [Tetrasphaera sp.]|nr:hypothetical protein [Tetrasphaera sp.]